MSIAQNEATGRGRGGVASIGELLSPLPGYAGDCLDGIEHVPHQIDRVRYGATISRMMQQFPEDGRAETGRRRRRKLVDILETFARQAPVTVSTPPIVWKYLHQASARICARDADWDSARGPLIAASNDHLRFVLGWNAARSNLAKLAEWGFAVPYCLAGNGKRYLTTSRGEANGDASGWSLAPILLLEDYLVELANREEELRLQHVDLPRRIRRATTAAYRIIKAFETEIWAHRARRKLAAIADARRIFGRRRVSLDGIAALERLARASERLVGKLLDLVSCAEPAQLTGSSDTRVQAQRHHQYNPNSASVSVDGLAGRRSGDGVSQLQKGPLEAASQERASPLPDVQEDCFGIERSGFQWAEATALFPFIEGLIDLNDRPGLDELHALARMNQISQSTAARASGKLGTEAAILCVLITAYHLHAGEIRKTPDAYMAALVKRAATGELNIGHTLFGRREAIFGRRETKASFKVNSMTRSSH